jgi:hypothetical protein
MNIALGLNQVKTESEFASLSFAESFGDIFDNMFGEMFESARKLRDKREAEACMLGEIESASNAQQASRSSQHTRFGPITITTRLEGSDMFSIVWTNRMNNSSIGIHKFAKGRYVVELGLASGARVEALNFKAIEHATAFAMLNTDVTRVQDDHALQARKHFLQFLVGREARAKGAVKFTKTAWQISRLRGQDVQFSEGTLDHIGRLMFLLPSEKALITTTDDKGKIVKHTVPFNNIWIQ